MSKQRNNRTRIRPGFTLVEIMIALTIASVLTAIALPTVKDAMRQNATSRAASLVKGAFLNARAQAIRTGRPFGIVLERQRHSIGSGTPAALNFTLANYATRLYYVQTPINYRGDTERAFAYPFEDTMNSNDPKFFIPSSDAGLIYAAAQALAGQANGSKAALRIINVGTKLGVGDSGQIFTVEDLEPVTTLAGRIAGANAAWAAVPGTIVHFDHIAVEPTYRSDGNHILQRAYPFQILALPTRAPMAPVSMPGKSVVDLSISGTAQNPVGLGTQDIVGTRAVPTGYEFNDVVVMFAPDGRLDAVYVDQFNTAAGAFQLTRVIPSTDFAFAVGYFDGIVDNVEDIARFPEHVPGTVFPTGATRPALADPLPPQPYQPTSNTPNFANPDCAWVGIQTLSGSIQLETVAGQPNLNSFMTYYGLGAAGNSAPASRLVAINRLRQSRRLLTAGATQ